jgi:hypothetical protein
MSDKTDTSAPDLQRYDVIKLGVLENPEGYQAAPSSIRYRDSREWIIQRCTQEWIGIELQYQDWGPYGPGTMAPLTRDEMIEALDAFQKKWPDDEFRGHNISGCKCHRGTSPE